jgi:hypothetical protein
MFPTNMCIEKGYQSKCQSFLYGIIVLPQYFQKFFTGTYITIVITHKNNY